MEHDDKERKDFIAGASETDISPKTSQFLIGYPHVKRYSTGIHDPLMSSALYLSDGNEEAFAYFQRHHLFQ